MSKPRPVRVILPTVPDVKPDELKALKKIAYSWRCWRNAYIPIGQRLQARLQKKGLTLTWEQTGGHGGHQLSRLGQDVLDVDRIRQLGDGAMQG